MKAMLWERWGNAWHRCSGPMDAAAARALAGLIRDPVSDDDPHDTRAFEVDAVGTIADMSSEAFQALKPKTWTTLRGRLVYVVRWLGPEMLKIYDDNASAYSLVVSP